MPFALAVKAHDFWLTPKTPALRLAALTAARAGDLSFGAGKHGFKVEWLETRTAKANLLPAKKEKPETNPAKGRRPEGGVFLSPVAEKSRALNG